MREAVLNSEGLSVQFASREDALDALDSVATGLLFLSARKHIARHLWMKDQPYAIVVCDGTSLTELFRDYLGRSRDKARFMLQLSTRCPIDDGVEAADLGNFLDEEVDGLPHCTDLLWCAISATKVSVSLSPNTDWHRNPLSLRLIRNGAHSRTVEVENVFSVESARDTADRLIATDLVGISPDELWNRRADLFPNLVFGLDVEKQLKAIGSDLFSSAVSRLVDLNTSAADWDATNSPTPTYICKVTGESASTMQKYGGDRVFRSSNGQNATFEKHARLHDGARIHLREIAEQSAIEIGYVGKHLRIVSED
ncbi:hypothetical protein PVW48_03610 [Dinoroseobacter sp. PD6]|uniref:hypothetical protein n=1 Tax=Dinoroseobacter sp. PD6 TaxID=3028384 RepID=UPI00237A9ED5|nr:hypothetical protein [Dinoroseobacter sp. PD6]MDD9715813.1 hypothetical protein [Dinoroseobacter sp. PD6]